MRRINRVVFFVTVALFPVVVTCIGVTGSARMLYPDHIEGAFTGGFGEESCHSCHFDYAVNQPGGRLHIRGLDTTYTPGNTYRFEIVLERGDMREAGFQLTARFKDGRQAGHFETDEALAFTSGVGEDVRYLQHAAGTTSVRNGKKQWNVTWTAPTEEPGTVIFNIAANAANGDRSEFGDWIYIMELPLSATGAYDNR